LGQKKGRQFRSKTQFAKTVLEEGKKGGKSAKGREVELERGRQRSEKAPEALL